MGKSNVLFIVNPISGKGKKEGFYTFINKKYDTKCKSDFVETKYEGHASLLSREATNNYTTVVAVGGDGTVNEVAKGLINSNVKMGIIPLGSGNGLARHLNIPLKINDAVEVIEQGQVKCIDTATVNGKPFVNVAGIGFDAHVAELFAHVEKRGAASYVKIITYEFAKYKPLNYKIVVDNVDYEFEAFSISFANSSQFGNNAYISPNALIDDGLLDVCILKNFPKIEAPQLAIRLFNKQLDKSKYMKIIRGKNIQIKCNNKVQGHLDGESVMLAEDVDIRIVPASLNVIYREK